MLLITESTNKFECFRYGRTVSDIWSSERSAVSLRSSCEIDEKISFSVIDAGGSRVKGVPSV